MTALDDVRRIQQALLSEGESRGGGWWRDLSGEVGQKRSGKFLAGAVAAHLASAGLECSAGRPLCAQHFFCRSVQSGVDRRYRGIGIEEKCAPLSPGTLIDGTISRGLTWVLGDPQGIPQSERGALGLIVTLGGKRIQGDAAALYFPVLEALEQVGVFHLIVNGNTGQHWPRRIGEAERIPEWLSSETGPWPSLDAPRCIREFPDASPPDQVAFGRHLRFTELCSGARRVAYAWCSNHWRMLDVGLLLRAKGYAAVRVQYDGPNVKAAGKGVEQRVAGEMWRRFGVQLDWGKHG